MQSDGWQHALATQSLSLAQTEDGGAPGDPGEEEEPPGDGSDVAVQRTPHRPRRHAHVPYPQSSVPARQSAVHAASVHVGVRRMEMHREAWQQSAGMHSLSRAHWSRASGGDAVGAGELEFHSTAHAPAWHTQRPWPQSSVFELQTAAQSTTLQSGAADASTQPVAWQQRFRAQSVSVEHAAVANGHARHAKRRMHNRVAP
jgi:hypothetical protein